MERLVFGNTLEGVLIHGPGKQLGPEARQALKEMGIDLSKPLDPAYPEALWQRALALVVPALYPELPLGEGYRVLGEAAVEGVRETLMGKAMAAGARLLGPRRVLLRMGRNLRSSSNCTDAQAQEISERCVEVHVSEYSGRPELMQGSLMGAVRLSGGRNPVADILAVDRDRGTSSYRVRWSE